MLFIALLRICIILLFSYVPLFVASPYLQWNITNPAQQAWLVGVWYFWYVKVQGIFSVFFGTARLIISWVNPLGYDDEEIKVLVLSLTVLFQKS